MFKYIVTTFFVFSSTVGFAEVFSADTSCAAERFELRNLQGHLLQYTCRPQINQSATCCAGDTHRAECVSPTFAMQGQAGAQDAANVSSASMAAMTASVQSNIDRCNRELEKVHCPANEAGAMKIYGNAMNKLISCMENGKSQLAAYKNQADASAEASRSTASYGTAPDGTTKVDEVADHWIGTVDGKAVTESTYVPTSAGPSVKANWEAAYPGIKIQILYGQGH
jgi:hypothetical protein